MALEIQPKTKIQVGVFTLIGFVLIAGMVTYFGRLGEGLKSYYEIRVEYSNASGLLRGADVLMAGAKVGKVAEGPNVLPDMQGVYVMLKIFDHTKIPQKSMFTIGSSGLLGDRFVEIVMKPGAQDSPPIKPGVTIQGVSETGMADLAKNGNLLIGDMRGSIENINKVVKRLDAELLNEKNLGDITVSVKNLKEITTKWATASQKLDSITSNLQTVTSDARVAVQEIRGIVQGVQSGKGTLGMLLNDEQLACNISALVSNLKRHGILFYKDRKEQKVLTEIR